MTPAGRCARARERGGSCMCGDARAVQGPPPTARRLQGVAQAPGAARQRRPAPPGPPAVAPPGAKA